MKQTIVIFYYNKYNVYYNTHYNKPKYLRITQCYIFLFFESDALCTHFCVQQLHSLIFASWASMALVATSALSLSTLACSVSCVWMFRSRK